MRKAIITALPLAALATPVFASGGPFFSLGNTDFVVTIAFLIFVGILLYLKVPSIVAKMLDERAAKIAAELDEARGLREEAQALLASFERKQREVAEQSERLIAHAREEAELAAADARKSMEETIARRMRAAEEQIASAEAAAVREVRERAVAVATAAAAEVIAARMGAKEQNALIDQAIAEVAEKFH